jgi:phosphoglucomutase
MLICELAAFYKNKGMTLLDALNALYKKYGFWKHRLITFAFEGIDGMDKMNAIMVDFRKNPPVEIAGHGVEKVSDYLNCECLEILTGAKTVITLPKSNVLSFRLQGGLEVVVRPSGTEPKLKVYLTACADGEPPAVEMLDKMESALRSLILK